MTARGGISEPGHESAAPASLPLSKENSRHIIFDRD